MDNPRLMDNRKKPQPAPGVHRSQVGGGEAAYLPHSLKTLLWLMLNLLILESTCGHYAALSITGGWGKRKM